MSAFKRLGIDPSAIQGKVKDSDSQEQTKNTFAFKWSKRNTYESESFYRIH